MKISLFWFRRDLRLQDNIGLWQSLKSNSPIIPIFIFDKNILDELPRNDARVNFIYDSLSEIQEQLHVHGSSLLIKHGDPIEVFEKLIDEYDLDEVHTNKDYEPYGISRDLKVDQLLAKKGIKFHRHKDQVIFEESEITKADGKPYTVYTPYKNKWLSLFNKDECQPISGIEYEKFHKVKFSMPSLTDIGFEMARIKVKPFQTKDLKNYGENRNFPAMDSTSYLSPHLRFGTVSVREIIASLKDEDSIFLSELIWREFFMQILFHFPESMKSNFKAKYNDIKWRNNEAEFKLWCEGKTGYPMVDAGMRELNSTGYMHNRVRMITAGFLCKHLLIDWRWGEAYFAKHLLDFELSSNIGNWQWSSGTGCDSAPYFRIFNPTEQLKKFDKELTYVRKWIPEYESFDYPKPIVDHKEARLRALETYKIGLNNV